MKVRHAFTNPIADDPSFTGTKPSDWNADHTIVGDRAINVLDYLSAAQLADVTSFAGAVDVTAPITSAIAALPSTGGGLYFPAGKYKTTGGFTISVPCTIRGDGKPQLSAGAPSAGVTMITSSVDAVSVFTLGSSGMVRDLGIVDTAVSRTSGDAIVAYNASDYFQRVDVQDCLTWGFWNGINLRVSNSNHITNNDIESSLNYGLVVDNEVLSDAGDVFVIGNAIFPGQSGKTAAAAIKVRNGGCKIIGNAIVKNGGNLTNGIYADIRADTAQLTVNANKIEGVDAEPIKIRYTPGIVSIFGNVIITSNILRSDGVAAIIDANLIGTFVFSANAMVGSGTNAIVLTNSAAGVVNPHQQTGFTNNISNTGTGSATNKIYWDANPVFVGGQASSNVALYNAGTGGLGTKAQLTLAAGDDPTHTAVNLFLHALQTDGAGSTIVGADIAGTKAYLNGTGISLTFNGTGADYGGVNVGNDVWSLVSSATGSAIDKTALQWTKPGSVAIGPTAALATSATDGFLYIPTCAGIPSGTPTAITGKVPLVYDSTNNNLYIYNSGWKKTTVFA